MMCWRLILWGWFFCSVVVFASEFQIKDSVLCRGESVLSGIDEFDLEPDWFNFIATSRVWENERGERFISYQVVPLVKPGRNDLYNGAKYLVRWKGLGDVFRKENKYALLVSPLWWRFKKAKYEPLEVQNQYYENHLNSEFKYLRFGLQGVFRLQTGIGIKGVALQNDKNTVIEVVNLDLKIEKEFYCPAFRFIEP